MEDVNHGGHGGHGEEEPPESNRNIDEQFGQAQIILQIAISTHLYSSP